MKHVSCAYKGLWQPNASPRSTHFQQAQPCHCLHRTICALFKENHIAVCNRERVCNEYENSDNATNMNSDIDGMLH